MGIMIGTISTGTINTYNSQAIKTKFVIIGVPLFPVSSFYKKMKIAFIIISTIVILPIYSQTDSIKNGAYRTCLDFNNNQPLITTGFIFEKMNSKKASNLYMVFSKDLSIKDIVITKSIWAIYDHGTFYFNVERFGMAPGYLRFDTLKKYNYFKGVTIGAMKIRRDNAKEVLSAVLFAESIATLSNGSAGASYTQQHVRHVNYILDMNSGLPRELTRNYVLSLIEPYEDLKGRLQYTDDEVSVDDLLYYIDILNEREKLSF